MYNVFIFYFHFIKFTCYTHNYNSDEIHNKLMNDLRRILPGKNCMYIVYFNYLNSRVKKNN